MYEWIKQYTYGLGNKSNLVKVEKAHEVYKVVGDFFCDFTDFDVSLALWVLPMPTHDVE